MNYALLNLITYWRILNLIVELDLFVTFTRAYQLHFGRSLTYAVMVAQ